MPTLKSSVLVIGHPSPGDLDFGADTVATLAEARTKIQETRYPVVVSFDDRASFKLLRDFFSELNLKVPYSQKIVRNMRLGPDELQQLVNEVRIFKFLETDSIPQLESSVQEALAELAQVEQNRQLIQLFNEQNNQLVQVSQDLEKRVKKRQQNLEGSKDRLLKTTRHLQALHKALIAVYRAQSTAEMERLLTEALAEALQLSWTRVVYVGQTQTRQILELKGKEMSLFTAALLRENEPIGHIFFAREIQRPFTESDDDFLGQISDAVALALERIHRLEQSENLKHQWETTFDAISEPVSIIDSNYRVERANRAFATFAGLKSQQVVGRKCYEVLFHRESPCEQCHLGGQFKLPPYSPTTQAPVIFNVTSQKLSSPEATTHYVNMYRDISERYRLERQILESAKMAELGTIGGSIAHELNNPLSGIITFLQLIKMDLKGDEPYYQDIVEMELGSQRCKEIIQNLLGFSRQSDTTQPQPVKLAEAIRKSIQLLEIQTRSLGISIHFAEAIEDRRVQGFLNPLTQAFVNLLQSSLDRLILMMKSRSQLKASIEIKMAQQDERCAILFTEIVDTEFVSSSNPEVSSSLSSLGLRVAEQIFIEHGGVLELFARSSGKSALEPLFARLVF